MFLYISSNLLIVDHMSKSLASDFLLFCYDFYLYSQNFHDVIGFNLGFLFIFPAIFIVFSY